MTIDLDDLVFAFKVDGATHQDQRRIERIFVTPIGFFHQERIRTSDNFVLNTLLLAFVVNTHVAKNSEAKFSYLSPFVFKGFSNIFIIQDFCELWDGFFSK